ncbi:MAG TPA: tripartite tricarboxylate transporter permease [Thermodesulfobacteriota bacterium]|nr:tripartite tricarboxylate transporter permease [Thermodesulfobacteriota bacterium]
MDAFQGLVYGFGVALSLSNLLACLVGVLVGTIVGVLPGIGPIGAMALLIPSTFALSPTTALIMMSGIYYGSMYGGSTTSILVNVPGEAASVVTGIDGYRLARKGRAGAALAVAATGSFVAGTLGIVALMFFAPPLADFALEFGPPEYFALTLVGLFFLSRLGGGSAVKSFLMVTFGLLLGTVGMEPISGISRFTLGRLELGQGVELVPVAMGLYGIGEVLIIAEQITRAPELVKVKFRELFPTRAEWRRSFPPMLRGGAVGFFIGLIPGPAAILSTFASYALEKRISKHPEEFGKGAIEGVAGPESANNSATAGAMVPLLALGVPFAPATAMLLGALIIHGVQPGPLLLAQQPEIFWGVVASMYIGNFALLILNLPLVGVFASLLRLPQHYLMGFILLLCLVGTYSVNNSFVDLYILVGMGVVGYFLRKLKFDMAPLILALVLGPNMEKSLRQSLFMFRGDLWAMISRPIPAVLFSVALAIIVLPVLMKKKPARTAPRV